MKQLTVGEMVEVRSKEDILKTLGRDGKLEGLPFMPEMFAYCGRRFRVSKRAHKTCDTVNDYKGRKMKDCVHLEDLRCDGTAHGGCQAGCLTFWKLAWLKPVTGTNEFAPAGGGCTEAELAAATQTGTAPNGGGPIYSCQATLLPAATEPLPWWSPGQYLEDFTSGNIGLGRMFNGFLYMACNGLATAGIGLGRVLKPLYDSTATLRGGFPYPRREGVIPVGTRTPSVDLGLQPGDWVRVRSYGEILATLDICNKNRGLYFDAEMVPYCGRVFRVLKRVTRIVHEKQGTIQEFKTPCVILEGGVCESRYSECRLFCPRAIYSYWREIWLERVPTPPDGIVDTGRKR